MFIRDIKQSYATLFDINNVNWFVAEHDLNSDVKKSHVAPFEEFFLIESLRKIKVMLPTCRIFQD